MEVFNTVAGFFEEVFENYLPQLHQGFLVVNSYFGNWIAADTNQRGRIFEVVAESSSGASLLHGMEVDDKPENNVVETELCDGDDKAFAVQCSRVHVGDDEPLVLPRGPAKVKYTPSKAYENVKAKLQFFEDNGNFEEFDKYSRKMVKICTKYEDFDIVVAVKVEQARSEMYRNAFRSARRLANEARKLAGRTRSPSVFTGQALLILSTVARNKSKLGKAQVYLNQVEQCFHHSYSIEDLARFHEVNGSNLDALMGKTAQPCEEIKEQALASFRKMYEVGSQDSRQRVSDKKRFYALLRTARILLDSNHPIGRTQRTVSEDAINFAEDILGNLERDFLDIIPRGSKIQFQMVKSDLYYRKDKFTNAFELLGKSLNEAKEFGYETEGPKITQRIEEIEQRLVIKKKIVYGDGERSDTSTAGGYESESQSESDLFSSDS